MTIYFPHKKKDYQKRPSDVRALAHARARTKFGKSGKIALPMVFLMCGRVIRYPRLRRGEISGKRATAPPRAATNTSFSNPSYLQRIRTVLANHIVYSVFVTKGEHSADLMD